MVNIKTDSIKCPSWSSTYIYTYELTDSLFITGRVKKVLVRNRVLLSNSEKDLTLHEYDVVLGSDLLKSIFCDFSDLFLTN
jgi:hypothetical protein